MYHRKSLFYIGWLVLVIGALYTLQDYAVAISWFRLSPWSVIFIIVGIHMMIRSCTCHECKPKEAAAARPVPGRKPKPAKKRKK